MSFRELAVSLRDHSLNSYRAPGGAVREKCWRPCRTRRSRGAHAAGDPGRIFFPAESVHAEEPGTSYGDLTIRPLRSVSPGSTFELTYGIVERAEGIRLQMEYHTALYKKATIRRMLRHFETDAARPRSRTPDMPVSEMALLTEEGARHARTVVDDPEAAGEMTSGWQVSTRRWCRRNFFAHN